MRDGRIKYFAQADYNENTELDKLIKAIIDRTASNEALESYYYNCKKEHLDAEKKISDNERNKIDLINSLENSYNFANTHTIISKLNKIDSWTEDHKKLLFKIACENTQVKYILTDKDVTDFYTTILNNYSSTTDEYYLKIKELLKTN